MSFFAAPEIAPASMEAGELPRLDTQMRIPLVESFLRERDECHVAIKSKSGLLGLTRLIDGENHSWVHIKRGEGGAFDLMWTSGKGRHDPLWTGRNVYSIGIDAEGRVYSFYESALSLWLKYHREYRPDEAQQHRAEEIARQLFRLLAARGQAESALLADS